MFDLLFSPYKSYTHIDIVLELTAIFFGLLSVWLAKNDSVLVFPTGIINTVIYVYLFWECKLLGDMMINGYYVIMGFYGWFVWTRKKGTIDAYPISTCNLVEKKYCGFLFLTSIVFVVAVYLFFNKFTLWISVVDTLVTSIFFVGMWLMAKRKIENWLFWIVGNLISIPMFFIKGLALTSIQYLIFTIIAVFGYIAWNKTLHKTQLVH